MPQKWIINKDIVEPDLSYRLTGIFFAVQKELGRFCREVQYCDALERKLRLSSIVYEREYHFPVGGRFSNRVDFLIERKIIIEVKAKPFITKDDYFQIQRYLHSARLKLGMIVNFRSIYLYPKRVLNPRV